MSLRYGLVAGFSLMALPVLAGGLAPAGIALAPGSRPALPALPLIRIDAIAADPLDAHAAVAQAQAGLSEIDASITLLDEGARKLAEAERKKAHDALQALRATRDAYKADIDTLATDVGSATQDEIAKVRNAINATWTRFHQELDAYFTAIDLDVASRKAVLQAQVDAEARYWQQSITDLKASVVNLTAEKRAAIEARIAGLQARVDAAKARLARLQQSKAEAWSALQKGLSGSRKLFGDTYESIEKAIDSGTQ